MKPPRIENAILEILGEYHQRRFMEITREIYQSSFSLQTFKSLRNSVHKALLRLVKKELIIRISRGLYRLNRLKKEAI